MSVHSPAVPNGVRQQLALVSVAKFETIFDTFPIELLLSLAFGTNPDINVSVQRKFQNNTKE